MTRTTRALALLLALAGGVAQAAPDGRAIYQASCAPCHGVRGDGRGSAARWLDVPPRDFLRGQFKLRSTPSGSAPTDADLAEVIRRGMPGTSMPGWGAQLSGAEIASVVEVVKAFAATRFLKPPTPVAVPPRPPLPMATLRSEGRLLWDTLRCWDCHGKQGRGDGPSAKTTRDDQGRRLRPSNLTRRLAIGEDPAAIVRILLTGMDGSPMPSYADAILFDAPDSLDDAGRRALLARRLWALAEFVRSLRARCGTLEVLFRDQAGRYDVP